MPAFLFQYGISILAPHEGCDRQTVHRHRLNAISILAPHEGCDVQVGVLDATEEFQSSHPMRGATPRRRRGAVQHLISILAPHEGCDALRSRGGTSLPNFNPRTP